MPVAPDIARRVEGLPCRISRLLLRDRLALLQCSAPLKRDISPSDILDGVKWTPPSQTTDGEIIGQMSSGIQLLVHAMFQRSRPEIGGGGGAVMRDVSIIGPPYNAHWCWFVASSVYL